MQIALVSVNSGTTIVLPATICRKFNTELTNAPYDPRRLLMYPSFIRTGLGIRFRSGQFAADFELSFADSLDLCPAGHVWVKCMACHKFHFPWDGANCHVQSRKHTNQLWWADSRGTLRSLHDYSMHTGRLSMADL